MHLLFLGIIKSSLNTMKKWLSKNGYLTDFFARSKFLNVLLDDVNIEWLRIEDFREGKFGGWVSENFVAFSRIFLWFFQDIGSLLQEDLYGPDSTPPSERPNPNTWRKRHYKRWLHERNVEFGGTNKEMEHHINALINRPGGPPPKVDRVREREPEQIERVLLSLDAMIVVLMTDEVEPEVTCPLAELRIKHFLAEFDILDQSCLRDDKKPKVITASNYLTLLNLPETIRKYGPLREYFEGMFAGEGYVRTVKPHVAFGQRVNFAYNAMSHCHRECSLDMATEQFDQPDEPQGVITNHWANLMQASRASFTTYDARKDVLDCLINEKVLSTVAFLGPKDQDGSRDVHVYAAAKWARSSENPVKFQLYRLEMDPSSMAIEKLSMRYHEWTLSCEATIWGDLLENYPPPDSDFTFACLLPLVCDTDHSAHMLVCKDRSVYS
jgi:hypothetical protein